MCPYFTADRYFGLFQFNDNIPLIMSVPYIPGVNVVIHYLLVIFEMEGIVYFGSHWNTLITTLSFPVLEYIF
jgi:hypothetical protein